MERTNEPLGLLALMDRELEERDRRLSLLSEDFCDGDGKILRSRYGEYIKRRDAVLARFDTRFVDLERRLDELCGRIRRAQPDLTRLTAGDVRKKASFPRNIALGRIHVQGGGLDIYVPRSVPFPFSRPVYLEETGQNDRVHRLFLRLLYTLPIGRVEFHVYDGLGLGQTVSPFNRLFSEKALFPAGKVLSYPAEIKECLKNMAAYAEDLIQNVFTSGLPDWDSYNRALYRKGEEKKLLPYKVLSLFELPEGLDDDGFEYLLKLARHCERCGILLLFSFDGRRLDEEEARAGGVIDRRNGMLRKLIAVSAPLQRIAQEMGGGAALKAMTLREVDDELPGSGEFQRLLKGYLSALREARKRGTAFPDLADLAQLYDRCSAKEIKIPLGFRTANGEVLEMCLGDETPHYLIGGASGSGKSNLLHVLILSACLRYSPKELQLFLLDFKDGVEFSAYAAPPLPHAQLVACRADTEYGLSVLRHLVGEKERRNALFKRCKVKDISGYRRSRPDDVLPRLVLIVDEFQELFQPLAAARAQELLTVLAKQGRACGIHVVLATQSLKGIDFSAIGSQFGGRVALKCDAEDSRALLGGGSAAFNEAAAGLERFCAILNTDQGAVDKNTVFSVPFAEPFMAQTLELIRGESGARGDAFPTKIYTEDRRPEHPPAGDYTHQGPLRIRIGEELTYEAPSLTIPVEPRRQNNLLICGSIRTVTEGILRSLLLSAEGCGEIDEIVYIGDSPPQAVGKPVLAFAGMAEFYRPPVDQLLAKRRLVILDNRDLIGELEMPPYAYAEPSAEGAVAFVEHIKRANAMGSCVAAFYDSVGLAKGSGLLMDEFRIRIAYGMSGGELADFTGNAAKLFYDDQRGGTALYIHGGVGKCSFKPYVGGQR